MAHRHPAFAPGYLLLRIRFTVRRGRTATGATSPRARSTCGSTPTGCHARVRDAGVPAHHRLVHDKLGNAVVDARCQPRHQGSKRYADEVAAAWHVARHGSARGARLRRYRSRAFFRAATPSFSSTNPAPGPIEPERSGTRDRVPTETVERAPWPRSLRPPRGPRYAEMIERICDTASYDINRFRTYRGVAVPADRVPVHHGLPRPDAAEGLTNAPSPIHREYSSAVTSQAIAPPFDPDDWASASFSSRLCCRSPSARPLRSHMPHAGRTPTPTRPAHSSVRSRANSCPQVQGHRTRRSERPDRNTAGAAQHTDMPEAPAPRTCSPARP